MKASVAEDLEQQLISHGDVGNPAREVIRRLTLRFFRYIHSRENPYRIQIYDRRFVVAPGVFTPSYRNLISTKASELLAANLRVPAGARVLDMGTGTGIQGIFAADRASRVVATDINPEAVACARENIRLNQVTNIEVRCGDTFEPVAGEQFDFIVWLPPAFFVAPRNVAEMAFACGRRGEILAKFCRDVGKHLSRDGVIQFSCVDRTRRFVLEHLQFYGFRLEMIKKVNRLPMETCTQFLAWLH
jgi:HemK-related putative methylase